MVGPDLLPVPAVESFLVYLEARELSPTTVKTYAYALAAYFTYLEEVARAWETVRLDDLAGFIAWLRRPAPNVIVLDAAASRRSASTVNKMLAAVSSFYGYQVRNGCDVADRLVVWRNIASRRYKPFLHHVTKSRPMRTSPLKLQEDRRRPKTLTGEEVQALLDACIHVRDRFLLALLYETGMRIGQALGLRHEDIRGWAGEVAIVPRDDNANGARTKCHETHVVHISADLARLYSDYMHAEYGDLESDYVFVNLWGGERGRPWGYAGVYRLVRRLRAATGIAFGPHMLRHTHATELLRAGVSLDVVSRRLTHASVATHRGRVQPPRRRGPSASGGALLASPGDPMSTSALRICDEPGREGYWARLRAAVRDEFRVDVYRPARDDAVLGPGLCRVEGCEAKRNHLPFCCGHEREWAVSTLSEAEFAATAKPARVRLTAGSRPCLVPECPNGAASSGLCEPHRTR